MEQPITTGIPEVSRKFAARVGGRFMILGGEKSRAC
jgi:hypothetical protein